MINIEQQYLNLLNEILTSGNKTSDRTGTGTISLFGKQLVHNFSEGFPLLTTKKVFWRGVVEELLWMLRGETNISSLKDKGVNIWDQWADENGELGPVYGAQWRKWKKYAGDFKKPEEFDQIEYLIKRIKTNPDCRRLILSAWNVGEIDQMRLPPCHHNAQFKVYGNQMSLMLTMRSSDTFLGLPFNIAQYGLLLFMFCKICDKTPNQLIVNLGDVHIYNNHVDQVKEQLKRIPFDLPKLTTDIVVKDPVDYEFEDFVLENYEYHPAIKADVSI